MTGELTQRAALPAAAAAEATWLIPHAFHLTAGVLLVELLTEALLTDVDGR